MSDDNRTMRSFFRLFFLLSFHSSFYPYTPPPPPFSLSPSPSFPVFFYSSCTIRFYSSDGVVPLLDRVRADRPTTTIAQKGYAKIVLIHRNIPRTKGKSHPMTIAAHARKTLSCRIS